jgi:hypothetical protein
MTTADVKPFMQVGHWSDEPASPEEMLLGAVWDVEYRPSFHEEPPFHDEVDGITLRVLLLELLHRQRARNESVVRLRFGFDEPQGLPFNAIGERVGVTGSYAQQVLYQALRRLRHPATAPLITKYRRWTPADDRAALARQELACLLAEKTSLNVTDARIFAQRCTRKNLSGALKGAHSEDFALLNRALVYSCKIFQEHTDCLLCDEPALPGIDWCLEHIQQLKRVKQIVVVCSKCEKKFIRGQAYVIPRKRSFCSRECAWAYGMGKLRSE